jgi:hypothetical protein
MIRYVKCMYLFLGLLLSCSCEEVMASWLVCYEVLYVTILSKFGQFVMKFCFLKFSGPVHLFS